ncbi:MAG: formate dehydrogenase accessory sulfurtransferase FdhD [Desulfobacterales bacterium]|nr:formate dehydrogenase accessory sulfurtransferase FdhD [Desulfobacterales bacterium]MDX2513029.1 formate dehydrogenase accessory sulfurtransferase FdhD [Desulfobacterales bacterium]
MLEYISHKAMAFENNAFKEKDQELILEEPLSMRIDGNPYAVVMRTPGHEINHAAGFFLSEGLVNHKDNFATIGYCTEEGVNVVTATLQPDRKRVVKGLLERRGFVSQTSCGICGKELIKDIYQIVTPVTNRLKMSIADVGLCFAKLVDQQSLYKTTRGAHAAMILDNCLNPISFAEDVGRHNALDKAIGSVFMETRLHDAGLAVMSSRISYELVQKAARAGIEMIVALSRPTALAVELASRLNMTLACLDKSDAVMVFCGKNRFQ